MSKAVNRPLGNMYGLRVRLSGRPDRCELHAGPVARPTTDEAEQTTAPFLPLLKSWSAKGKDMKEIQTDNQ